MPVELSIVESVTELETTVVEVVLDSSSAPGIPGPGVPTGGTDGQVLTKQSGTDYDTDWEDPTGGGGGAPVDATYLVTTADGTLTNEVVVGATPGGELGGTWASPTVDASHSGSTHAAVQAAAEATAAAALSSHEGDTTSIHGIADTSALALTANHPSNATFNDHSARHENGGADEISLAGLDGTPTDLQTHLDDTTAAHAGTAISNTPAGNIAATTVQAALNELDSEKAATSHAHAGEDITSGTVADARIASTITRDSEWQARALTAGNGLAGGGDLSADRTFSVNVDDSSIEINSDTLRVKAGGVTAAMVASDVATQAELDAHINDTSAAHAASAISADSTTLVGTGTDVQAVLEELDNGIADHLADSSDAHDASAISFSPTGSIAATDVQAAIAEVASEASGIPTDGWISAGETWTYASADDPTFTFTISGDLTGKYQPGHRLKLTQTTAKYFIVTKVEHSAGTTTITVYGGTDYDLANAAISSPYWSPVKAPFGFPLDPAKWTHEATDTADRTQASPVNGTWYNLGSITLAIPIGAWRVYYEVIGYVANSAADTTLDFNVTLSTANNSESDKTMTGYGHTADGSAAGKATAHTVRRERHLTLTSKTSYFLNAMVGTGGSSLFFFGATGTTVIRAVCAYL